MTDKFKFEVTPQMYKSFTGERKYTTAKYYTFYNFIRHKTSLLSDDRFKEAVEIARKKFSSADEKELYTRAFYDLQDTNQIEFTIKEVDSVMNQFVRARAATSDVARKAAEEKVLKVVNEGEITFNNWDYFFSTIDKPEVVSVTLEPTYKFTTYRTYVDPANKGNTVAKVAHNTIKGVTSHTCNFLESDKISALCSVLKGSTFEEITNSIHLAACIQSICLKNYIIKSPEEFAKLSSGAKCKPLIGNQMVMNMLWMLRNYLIITDSSDNKFTMSCDMASTDMSSIEIYKKMDVWAQKANDMLVCLLCLFVKNAGHSNIFVDVPGVLSTEFLKKYEDKCWRKSLYSYVRQASNSLLGTNGVYDENVRVINTKTYFEKLATYRDYSQTTALLNCLMFVPKKNTITSASEKIKIKNSNPKPLPIEDFGTVPARTLIMWGVVEGLISSCPDNAESCSKTMGVVVLPDKCLVTLSNKGKLSVRVGPKSFIVLSAENVNPHDLSLHLSSLASYQDPKTLYITPSVIITLLRSTVYNLIKASVGSQEKKGVADLLKKFKNDEGYFRYNACDSESSQLEQIIYSFHHYSPNFVYANLIKCGNWSLKPETVEDLTNYLIGTSCLLLIEHSTLLASRCGLRKKVAGFEETVKKIKEAQEKYHTVKTMSEVSGSGGDAVVAAQNELINALYKDKKKETISMLYSLTTYGQTGKFNNLAVGYEPEWVETFNKLVAVERSTVELAVSTNDGFAKHVLDGGSDNAIKQCVITSTLCTNAMSASPFVVTYDRKFLGGGYGGIQQVTNIGNVTNYNCSPLDIVHISETEIVKTAKEAGTAMETDKENTYDHDAAIQHIYYRGKQNLISNLIKWTKNKEISAVVRGLKATPAPEVKDTDMITPPDIYVKFAAPGPDSITVKVGELAFSFSSSYASLYSMYKGEELKSNVIDAIRCGKLDENIKTKMSSVVHSVKKSTMGMSNAIEVLGLSLDPLMNVTVGQSEEFCANWVELLLKYKRMDFGVLATLIELSKAYIVTKSMWLAAACLQSYRDADHSTDYYKPLSEFEFTDCSNIADKENMEQLIKCAKLYDRKSIKSRKIADYYGEAKYHLIADSVGGGMSKYNTQATMKGFLKSKSYTDIKAELAKEQDKQDLTPFDKDEVEFVGVLNSNFPVVSDKFRDIVVTNLEYPGSYISYSYDCYCKVINVFTDPKGERLKGCFIPTVKFQLVSEEEAERLSSEAISSATEKYSERVKNLAFSAGTDPTAFKSKIIKMSLIRERGSFEVRPSTDSGTATEAGEEETEEKEEEENKPDEKDDNDTNKGSDEVDTTSVYPPPPPPPPPAAPAAGTGDAGGDVGNADQSKGNDAPNDTTGNGRSTEHLGKIGRAMSLYQPLKHTASSLFDTLDDLIKVSPDNEGSKDALRRYRDLAFIVSDLDLNNWGKSCFEAQYKYAGDICNQDSFDQVLDLTMTRYGDLDTYLTDILKKKVGSDLLPKDIMRIADFVTPYTKGTNLDTLYGRVMIVMFTCVMHGLVLHSYAIDTYMGAAEEGLPIAYDKNWYVAIGIAMSSYFSLNLKPAFSFLKDNVFSAYNNLFALQGSTHVERVVELFKEPPVNLVYTLAVKNLLDTKSLELTSKEKAEMDNMTSKYYGLIVYPGLKYDSQAKDLPMRSQTSPDST